MHKHIQTSKYCLICRTLFTNYCVKPCEKSLIVNVPSSIKYNFMRNNIKCPFSNENEKLPKIGLLNRKLGY
jgi:hypothetical protein